MQKTAHRQRVTGVVTEAHLRFFQNQIPGGQIRVPGIEDRIRFEVEELKCGLNLGNCLGRLVEFGLTFWTDGSAKTAINVRPGPENFDCDQVNDESRRVE